MDLPHKHSAEILHSILGEFNVVACGIHCVFLMVSPRRLCDILKIAKQASYYPECDDRPSSTQR